ncbi:MAG: hypothetical protein M1831_004593 [Alyxoria varia]|nr:MAG: hypothetical protein M1831_004593 [Alyxoria varia]
MFKPIVEKARDRLHHHNIQTPLQRSSADANDDASVNATAPTLTISLQNVTRSPQVYAYITGQALDNSTKLFLLRSDGQTPYFPGNPNTEGAALAEDTAIPLGAPGTSKTVKVPHLAGARLWFSVDSKLTFKLNPGANGAPALVEPASTNASDPNIGKRWGFCEFTYNDSQLYANVSYVDFVSLPIGLRLKRRSAGAPDQTVSGMAADGLEKVAQGLRAQEKKDGVGWGRLVVDGEDGRPLRILSPNNGAFVHDGLFRGYYDEYVNRVWRRYSQGGNGGGGGRKMALDTQGDAGVVTGSVNDAGELDFGGKDLTFQKPSTVDIFGNSTGPFVTGGSGLRDAIIPRLAAAFNRSTLLRTDDVPGGIGDFYKEQVTNHFARVVHEVNLDGKGYAFPYDDVSPADGDQSGKVQAGDPELWSVSVGGVGITREGPKG